jgi:hypothetical protein
MLAKELTKLQNLCEAAASPHKGTLETLLKQQNISSDELDQILKTAIESIEANQNSNDPKDLPLSKSPLGYLLNEYKSFPVSVSSSKTIIIASMCSILQEQGFFPQDNAAVGKLYDSTFMRDVEGLGSSIDLLSQCLGLNQGMLLAIHNSIFSCKDNPYSVYITKNTLNNIYSFSNIINEQNNLAGPRFL